MIFVRCPSCGESLTADTAPPEGSLGCPRCGGVVTLAGKVPEGTEPLCPSNPDVVAQLHLAVQDEMAVSLQDVLLRRTGIGTSLCQGRDCAEAIGRRMASLLGWSPRRLAAELDGYHAHVARSHRFKA